MRRRTRLAVASGGALFVAVALASVGCSKKTDEPLTTTASSSPSAGPRGDSGAPSIASIRARTHGDDDDTPQAVRIDGGIEVPVPNPVEVAEPDWDLDRQDPARDYVIRYIRATERYADKTRCVQVGPSTDRNGQKAVEVKDDPKASCFANGGASPTVRDVFLVDTASDRLTVDDPTTRAALKRWPDGSDPAGPAAAVKQLEDNKHFRGPLRDAIVALQLVPIRVQFYGRGSYPVITLAGWHDPPIKKMAPPPSMKVVAEKICAAGNNTPVSLIGGFDRSLVLQVRCPGVGPQDPPAPAVAWKSLVSM